MSGCADDPIALCLAGRISPEVALARLALAGFSAEQIAARLETCRPKATEDGMLDSPSPLASEGDTATPQPAGTAPLTQPLLPRAGEEGNYLAVSGKADALSRVLSEHGANIARLHRLAMDSGLDHSAVLATAGAALAHLRAAFDRAVSASPEAAVAAYSLGDPAILEAATGELVDWLAEKDLTGSDRDVLDLGCGIGRVSAALAPRCRSVLGLDLSPSMIAEARRREGADNLRFEVTSGADLAGLPDSAYDLVLAVDTFPYLMQAGLTIAERHVCDAARLLRPGGYLAVLNLSYGRGLEVDRADAARWAAAYGLALLENGGTPFRLWDGAAFLLRAAG
jgi:SAM-dependent methyltransferase